MSSLLDIGIPGADGHELARRLPDDEKIARALLVAATGYANQVGNTIDNVQPLLD